MAVFYLLLLKLNNKIWGDRAKIWFNNVLTNEIQKMLV